MGKDRLAAFSDGVIAIIITIMVLELKVPHGSDLSALAGRLGQLRPNCGHPFFYSITSSARVSSAGGMLRPSALAVLRLTTSSYFVGSCTGRLLGFSP